MKFATIRNECDPLQLPEDHSLMHDINSIIIQENPINPEKLHKKYLTLGAIFKLLKVSMHHADGNFFKMILNFPYFAIFYEKLEAETNLFLSKPKSTTLSAAWNISVI